MSQDLRVLLSILLSLAVLVVGCGCNETFLAGVFVQPTHTPTTRPTKTPTIQPTSTPTSTPAPTSTPTPVGWPATVEAVLFSDEPCAPPCWQGITPGVSTEEDVLRVLEQLKTAGWVEDYDRPSPGGFWVYPVGVDKVKIRLEDDRVEYIEGFYLRIGYRVEQAIERFGEPEAVVPYYRTPKNDRWSCEQWDDSIATIVPPAPSWLLYPSQGTTLVLDTPEPGIICPQMFISMFLYYQPRSLAEALDEDSSPVFGWNTTSQEDLVEWHGYGQGY